MGGGNRGRSSSDSYQAQTSGVAGGGGEEVALEKENDEFEVTLVDINPEVHAEAKEGETATRAGAVIQVSGSRLGDIAPRYREEAQSYRHGYVSRLTDGPTARVVLTS